MAQIEETVTFEGIMRREEMPDDAKRVEPQYWHDGTETYRIVYF